MGDMARGGCTHVGVALAGLEGELLLGHGLGVELGEGVGGAAEGGVERAVGLVQPRRGIRLPLPGHRRRRRRGWSRANRGGELDRRVCGLLALPICFPLWPPLFSSNIYLLVVWVGSDSVSPSNQIK